MRVEKISGSGGGGGKGGGGSTHVPSEARDSLRSKQYANVVDLLSEGEIVGFEGDPLESIYLDGTPIKSAVGVLNFSDVLVQYTTGTQTQAPINGQGFDTSFETAVSVKVAQGTPVVRTITSAGVTAIRVTLGTPGLSYQDPTTGDIGPTEVAFAIDVQTNGGGYVNRVTDSFNGKTTSRYQRAYVIPVTGAGPWDVRVTRVTADSTTSNLRNELDWDSYSGIIGANMRYPNRALVGISIDAEQFSSIPTRGYLVKGLKVLVPDNYDPVARTYTGVWSGNFQLAWTDNPAWCFYDLLMNSRYGLGDFINASLVDKFALYAIAQYCDELVDDGFGGSEPRFTCNLYLQQEGAAYTVLQNFASIFRGISYWSAGAVSVAQDRPDTSASIPMFVNANVDGGAFSYQGSSLKGRHTVALVAWNDPSDSYKQKIEYVQDEDGIKKYGVVSTQITAFGCTSRGQAHRAGKWVLYTESMETETVTFSTGLDGFSLYPGAVFKTSDRNRAGKRMGGRVRSATDTAVTIDDTITIEAGKTYTLNVLLPDGTVGSQPVTNAAGATSDLTLAAALAAIPQADAIWTLVASDLIPEMWRVVSITQKGKNMLEVTGIAHRPDKYAAVEQGLVLNALPTSNLTTTPDPVTNLAVTESLYLISQGASIGVLATVSWTASASRYRVGWRVANGAWQYRETVSTSVDIDVSDGPYEFNVVAINALGKLSAAVSVSYTVLGLRAPPQDVTGFGAVIESFDVNLTWNADTDLDLDHYEIRDGASWDTAVPVVSVKADSYKLKPLAQGTHQYWIKAVDTTGNYSVNAASLSVTIAGPALVTVTASVAGENIVLGWQPGSSQFAIDHFDVREGTDFATATLIAQPKSTAYTVKADFGGAGKFWVAAVDVAGNIGPAGSVDIAIQLPASVVVTSQVIDNNVLLKWTDATTTLPIADYEVSKGATYSVAQIVGHVGSGRFATIFEQAAGDYTYWVVPVDSAGNRGTPASVMAQVAQPPDYVLHFDYNSDFSAGTLVNTFNDNGVLYAPVKSETWQEHFDSSSWTSPQDQVNAGFAYYLEPSGTTASYEEIIDYGAVQPAMTITATLSYQVAYGNVTVVPTISVRAATTDPWIDAVGVAATFQANFRYVKVHYDISASGGDDLMVMTGLNVKLAIKHRSDSGSGTANAADANGTAVNFNIQFIDIDSITVTPGGTTPVTAIYDFVDAPYPTQFSVYLFDSSGNRVSGPFSWQARGV